MLQSTAPPTKEAHVPTRFLVATLLLLPLAAQSPAQVRTKGKQTRPSAVTAVVGKPAPAFRLNDHLGKMVRVGGESKNWTVIAFYPKAMTPG